MVETDSQLSPAAREPRLGRSHSFVLSEQQAVHFEAGIDQLSLGLCAGDPSGLYVRRRLESVYLPGAVVVEVTGKRLDPAIELDAILKSGKKFNPALVTDSVSGIVSRTREASANSIVARATHPLR